MKLGRLLTLTVFSLNQPTVRVAMFVSCVSVCLSVSLGTPCFPVDWKLQVKVLIANIGMPLDVFEFLLFQ